MKAMIDLCIVPLGVGVSLSEYIAACQDVLAQYNLESKLHAYGTNIYGEWDEVFAAVKQCHEKIHTMGVPRITTTIKVGTRTDRDQTIESKITSVISKQSTPPESL